jgi:mRNA interferase MazF
MVINQGDVYWIDLEPPVGSGPGYAHPYVVIQNDLFNRSPIATVVLCGLTSSLKLAGAPGNVLLEAGEANLPRRSVANVTQLLTVDKSVLVDKIGTLSERRVAEILDGVAFVLVPPGGIQTW